MEKREDLIRLLEECIQLEDQAIPLYSKHLENPEFFEGVSPEDGERVRKTLMTLAHDSQSHRWILESLLARAKNAPKDAQ